jgi:thiamine-phosphate pyrophosphorylase
MELIVISDPGTVADEAVIINRLFEAGMTRFHLRKPDWTGTQVTDLLIQVDKSFHGQIALHQHHYLAEYFEVKGLHYKEQGRINVSPEQLIYKKKQGYILSASVHDPVLLESLGDFDYVFFGPLFDSLSKPGYQGKLAEDFRLEKACIKPKVFALGGIDLSNLYKVKEMNFDGAALLGAIWNDPYQAVATFKRLKDLANN